MNQTALKDIISKNYTGDAEGFEMSLVRSHEEAVTQGKVPTETIVPPGEAERRENQTIIAQHESRMNEPDAPPARPVGTAAPETKTEQSTALVEDAPTNGKITKEEADAIRQGEKDYLDALAYIKDAIAPSMMKVDPTKIQIGDVFVRTFFTFAYPDFLEGNWLSPLINWDVKFDMSMFVYPVESVYIMKYLKKRLTELYSERSINSDKGLISDPALDAQIQDVEELR